jgi:hypothetical protein
MNVDTQIRWIALPLALALAGAVGAAPAKKTAQRTVPAVQRTVPADTVVRAQLEDQLSSRTAAKGDKFTALLSSKDRSGFPEGTTFHGVVTEVEHGAKEKPDTLDVKFTRAVLPGGQAVSVTGVLAGLEKDDVRRTKDGRLVSAKTRGGKFQTKWVGYGAAGGAVLSTIFGGRTLKGALLGALGGAAYGYVNKGKKKEYGEVELSSGTEFGIRLDSRAAFAENSRFRYATQRDE